MRFSQINKKIETDINVDDLSQLRSGMSVVKRFYKKQEK